MCKCAYGDTLEFRLFIHIKKVDAHNKSFVIDYKDEWYYDFTLNEFKCIIKIMTQEVTKLCGSD